MMGLRLLHGSKDEDVYIGLGYGEGKKGLHRQGWADSNLSLVFPEATIQHS